MDNLEFQQYVNILLNKHHGKRIVEFCYQGKKFWLKQPENVSLIWRLLKPNGKKSFLYELKTLQTLSELGAPVPKLILWGENFFVLDDAGKTADLWVENELETEERKQKVLNDCAIALAKLHQNNVIHGRPALRDIAWDDERVTFLDLESIVYSSNLNYRKVRDLLVFMHGIFRYPCIEERVAEQAILQYKEYDQQEIFVQATGYLMKFRWLYYFLLLFKPIAKKDLKALYGLFGFVLNRKK